MMHQVCILCGFIALQYEQSSVALCLLESAADVYDYALESAFFTDSLPCSVTELCDSISSGGASDRWSEIVFYDFRSGCCISSVHPLQMYHLRAQYARAPALTMCMHTGIIRLVD